MKKGIISALCYSILTEYDSAFIFVYKMDMVTSLKALNKTVESPQLTSDLGGTFTYGHTDWLQFHQVPNAVVTHPTVSLTHCGVSREFRGDQRSEPNAASDNFNNSDLVVVVAISNPFLIYFDHGEALLFTF